MHAFPVLPRLAFAKAFVHQILISLLSGCDPRVGVCAQHNVEVVFEPPNLRDLHCWDGCLISSTSRLLLPIDTCVHPSCTFVVQDYTEYAWQVDLAVGWRHAE